MEKMKSIDEDFIDRFLERCVYRRMASYADKEAMAALGGLNITALSELKGLASPPAEVLNVTAAVTFMLAPKGANLEKKATWANNWDKEVPHVGYFATKDIEPGEELTYLRKDGVQPTRGEHRVCGCGLDGCTGRI